MWDVGTDLKINKTSLLALKPILCHAGAGKSGIEF